MYSSMIQRTVDEGEPRRRMGEMVEQLMGSMLKSKVLQSELLCTLWPEEGIRLDKSTVIKSIPLNSV